MGKTQLYSSRLRAGFTLMELLVVVAVLAVVLAITAPALAPIMRGTEINRLDNYAKEMYVAVQDQFIGMEISGEYKQFNSTVGQAGGRNLGSLGFMPQDASNDEWAQYYYLTNFEMNGGAEADADNALAQVLQQTSIVNGLTSGARYVLEVNPRADGTDVYSVFYSEDPSFSYADVMNLSSRERADRMNTGNGYPVGYYCGFAQSSSEFPDHFAPQAHFVNGEELFLSITCAGGIALVGSEANIEVKVVLTDGQASKALSLKGGQDFHLDSSGNIDIDIVLDSMREGLHLADIFPDATPGLDISAQVEVEYNRGDTTISTPASARGQAKANSLYAKKNGTTVEVANVRHMQNLELLPQDIDSVSQVATINFNAKTWGSEEATQLSSPTRSYNEETYGMSYVNPLDPNTVEDASGFQPITTQGATWSFFGNGNSLYEFYIKGSGTKPTGLFSSVQQGQELHDIMLVDPVVTGVAPAGVLAGELYGVVDNCGVRLDINTAAQSEKQNSYVLIAQEGEGVGGLVGTAQGGARITNSFAAINVVAGSCNMVGGLVGSVNTSGSLSHCYASGEIDANALAGGLVGFLENGNVAQCYSTSVVYTTGIAGGLIGAADAGSVEQSSSYGRVHSTEGGGFIGAAGSTSLSSNTFLSQINYNDTLLEQPEGVQGKDYVSLASPVLALDHSHPYSAGLFGEAFPFTNVLDEHWGNWPAPVNLNPVMVYYELYGDGSYGYYGMGETPESSVEINTLDETLVVVEDGYALLSTYPIRGFEYNFNNGQETGRLTLDTQVGANTYVELPAGGMAYWNGQEYRALEETYIYQPPFSLQMPNRDATNYYDILQITVAGVGGSASVDYIYYYNPDFAKLATSPNAQNVTATPDTSTLLVRTARQLNRLAKSPVYWGATIAQDRDIDFAYYGKTYLGNTIDYMATLGSYANSPIGVAGMPFMGSYDGRNYAIIDFMLYAQGAQNAGLFGEVAGSVRNVHLATSAVDSASIVRSGSASSTHTMAVGGLVGWLREGGSLSGCSISGYKVFTEGSTKLADIGMGGLVGVNSGSIQACSAADTKVYMYSASLAGASIGVGGLVGSAQGSISRSYAVENELQCITTQDESGRIIGYGGIAGYVYATGARIADCYAYSFQNGTSSASDTISHYAIANPAYAAISNCYTLDVSSGAEAGSGVTQYNDLDLLANAPLAGFATSETPRNTYGETMSGHIVATGNYPYPVICQDAYGEWAHYGFSWR